LPRLLALLLLSLHAQLLQLLVPLLNCCCLYYCAWQRVEGEARCWKQCTAAAAAAARQRDAGCGESAHLNQNGDRRIMLTGILASKLSCQTSEVMGRPGN
jgi:hypothetical protein